MSRVEWQVRIDRVVVTGVEGPAPAATELRPLIDAVVRAAALPAGRSMRAAVQVQAPALGGAGAVAQAVGGAVGQALRGGRGHG